MTRTPAARRTTSTAIALLATALVAVGGGGVAYAYWAATGTGTTTTGTATALPLGVRALTTPTTTLYPGKTEDLGLLLSNTNPYPVNLTKLTAATVTSSDQAACPASNVVLPVAVTAGLSAGGYTLPTPISVPAAATATSAALSGFITLAATATDGCQAKTFTVSLSFSGTQVA